MIAVYAVAGEQVLAAVFGEDLTAAAGALPLLALAMSLLAWAYLSVQYLLALGRVSFVILLAVAPPVELALLVTVGAQLTEVAPVLVALQLVLAPAVFWLVLRSAASALAPPERGCQAQATAAARAGGFDAAMAPRRGRGGLADRRPGAAAVRARPRAPRADRRDRQLPRALGDRAGAGGAGGRGRSRRSTRTPATTAARRRSRPTPRRATPTSAPFTRTSSGPG